MVPLDVRPGSRRALRHDQGQGARLATGGARAARQPPLLGQWLPGHLPDDEDWNLHARPRLLRVSFLLPDEGSAPGSLCHAPGLNGWSQQRWLHLRGHGEARAPVHCAVPGLLPRQPRDQATPRDGARPAPCYGPDLGPRGPPLLAAREPGEQRLPGERPVAAAGDVRGAVHHDHAGLGDHALWRRELARLAAHWGAQDPQRCALHGGDAVAGGHGPVLLFHDKLGER
mmetsp:Transcript_90656/g.265337  ORF Transcript_90656/g.265337 Transcript_90656/m.265337 type:complete len:228 (+) Transcript_90656:1848-2531(+)